MAAAGAAVGAGFTTAVGAVSDAKIKLFFIIVVGLHIWDLLSGYNRIGGGATWWIAAYTVLALLVAPFFLDNREGFLKTFLSPKTFIFVGVSAIAFILPIIISKLPEAVRANPVFQFLIVISAPWMIYLFFSGAEDRMVSVIRNWWLFVWVVILIAVIFSSMNKVRMPTELQGAYRINPVKVIGDMWEMVADSFKKTFGRLAGFPVSINAFINRNLNDSIGRSYTGQVDPYASRDLGVQFTQLRVYSDKFMPGDEVVVWADIQGESFKDEIDLSLVCYARAGDGRVYNGTVNTQGGGSRLRIKMREKVSASCTFTSLPKGYYDIWFTGAFVFETWGYIQYYFAPDELVKNMWQQDLNPAREAGIPERPVGIFTGGPINLGLASEYDQPIPVDSFPADGFTQDRTLPPFGASIINQWSDGEVLSVRQITLMVPDTFILQNCDRDPVSGTRASPVAESRFEMPGYHHYTFGSIGGSIDGVDRVNRDFDSVTCFLGFAGNKQLTAEELIGSYDLVMKTFAARTNYLYMIKKNTRVKVDDQYY